MTFKKLKLDIENWIEKYQDREDTEVSMVDEAHRILIIINGKLEQLQNIIED